MIANQSATSMQRGKSMFNQPNWAATTDPPPQYTNTMSRAPTAARPSPQAVPGQTAVTHAARPSPAVYQPASHTAAHNPPGPVNVAPPKRQLPQRNTTAFPYNVGAKVNAPNMAPKAPVQPQVTHVTHAPPPQVKGPPVNNNAAPQHANHVPQRVNANPPPLQHQVTPVIHAPPPQVKGPPVNTAPPPVHPAQSTNQPPPIYPQQLSHGKVPPPQQAKSPAGHVTGPAPRTGPQQQPAYHVVHNYSTNQSTASHANQPGPKQPMPRAHINQPGPPQPGPNHTGPQPGQFQPGPPQPGPNPPRPHPAPYQQAQPKSGPRPVPANLSRSAPSVTPVNRAPPPQPQLPQAPNTLHRSAPIKPAESDTSALDQDTVWALNTLNQFDPTELSIYQPTPATAHKSGDSGPGASSAEVIEAAPMAEPQQSLLTDADSSFDIELSKFADLLDDNGVVMGNNNTNGNTANKSAVNGLGSHSAQNKQDVLELQQQNQRLNAEIDALKQSVTTAEQDRRLAHNELAAVKKKLQNREEECARLHEQVKLKDKEVDRLKAASTSDAQREIQKLTRQLNAKQREVDGLRSEYSFKEKDISEAHALKQTMDKELAEYRLQISKLKQDLSSANKSMMDLKRSHDKLQASSEVTRGIKRERDEKSSSDEPPNKLAKTSINNRFTSTTHTVLHDSSQYLTNKLVSVSHLLFALPSTLRDDALLATVSTSNPRRLSDTLDELCTKLENKTRECLLGHTSVEGLMQVLEEIVLFKHVALGGLVKVLEVLITILSTSKECRLVVLNKKKSDRSALVTVALVPNNALAQTQNPRISITSAGKTVTAAPSVSAAQPASPGPHSRLIDLLIDHLRNFVEVAAQQEKNEQQSSAVVKILSVLNIISWECEQHDLVQFKALLMTPVNHATVTPVMEALLNTKRFCHQINALALSLLKSMLSNKSLFEYARTNTLPLNTAVSTISPHTGTLLERIVVLVSKDQACDYWPRVVRQTAVELLSFIAAYYDEGLDVLLNIVNVTDELRDRSIDQSVYLYQGGNNTSVDLSIDLNVSLADKAQRGRLLIDPNKTTAFLSRLVLILFHEFNTLYESYHCNPSPPLSQHTAHEAADDTIFGEPQRKELIKEIIELLLRISSKLNLKSQLSSVQHQLVSVLTKIIQRDIPKELDLVADQAQNLKALLWDYDDLSQVRSQL